MRNIAERLLVVHSSETGKPVWVSWTLDENEPNLRSGETIRFALETLSDGGLFNDSGRPGSGHIDALMFNCTSPEVTTLALQQLCSEPLLPPTAAVGGYANGFVHNNTAEGGTGEYRDLSPDEYYTEFASRWLEIGGSEKTLAVDGSRTVVVGGCCGIFPQHIARIRQGMDGVPAAACQPGCSRMHPVASGLNQVGAFAGADACMCCAPSAV